MKLQLIILALALAMPGAPSAQEALDRAVTPEEKGRAIAVEAEKRYDGFGDSVVDLSMTLSNEEGRERTR
ncbi:MAG: outer membrane lipoprotein-sorting protein, partial [Gammaproteobacteria bacterium]|nr:outer membrane lipoprotein-sorting protein [Gammaproteobacteria bacterium]